MEKLRNNQTGLPVIPKQDRILLKCIAIISALAAHAYPNLGGEALEINHFYYVLGIRYAKITCETPKFWLTNTQSALKITSFSAKKRLRNVCEVYFNSIDLAMPQEWIL